MMHDQQNKLDIALVGIGRRGLGVRLPVIRLMKDRFNLVAICDLDGEKAAEVNAGADKRDNPHVGPVRRRRDNDRPL